MVGSFKFSAFVLSLTLALVWSVKADQNPDSVKSNVRNQIAELADYACRTILNPEGESRCDYNIALGKWLPYEPAWHTGQVINGLIDAFRLTGDSTYLDYAKKAGDWWCGLKIQGNPRLDGLVKAVHGDFVGDYIIFSTISDGTPGLFKLFRVTGDSEYAQIPTDAGRWMLRNMYIPADGMFYDAVSVKTGEVMKHWSPFWPGKKNQKLDDVARPNNEGSLFLDMYRFTNDERYRRVFLEICNSLVDKEGKEGLWMQFTPNNIADSSFHPRFNLWYAESLINGYELTKNLRYLEAARKTLKTYQKAQQKDGTIYYKNYLDGRFEKGSIAGSAVAFAGILWMRIDKESNSHEFHENIERSYEWISHNFFSYDHPDTNLRGGVIDIAIRSKAGKVWITQRDLGTIFALRFLVDYYRYRFE